MLVSKIQMKKQACLLWVLLPLVFRNTRTRDTDTYCWLRFQMLVSLSGALVTMTLQSSSLQQGAPVEDSSKGEVSFPSYKRQPASVTRRWKERSMSRCGTLLGLFEEIWLCPGKWKKRKSASKQWVDKKCVWNLCQRFVYQCPPGRLLIKS